MPPKSEKKKSDSKSKQQICDPNGTAINEVLCQTRELLYGLQNSNTSPNAKTSTQHTMQVQNVQSLPGQEHNQFQPHYIPSGMQNNIPLSSQLSFDQGFNIPLTNNGTYQSNVRMVDNSIPSWAANMCQQLNAIQIAFERQDQKWQSIDNNLQNQNFRILKIEKEFQQMTMLKHEIEKTNNRIEKLNSEMCDIKTKVKDYDETIKQYSDMCDEITANNTATDRTINNITRQVKTIENQQQTLTEKLKSTDEKIIDIQWRSMRDNLIFSGIPEAVNFEEEREDCEEVVQNFLEREMKLHGTFYFERVHRLGKYKSDALYPRPIVAKFTYYKQREYVRQQAPIKLKDTDYYVKEQYPQEMENRRKQLYPVAKEARKNKNNQVRLIRDKLYINNKEYRDGDPIPGIEWHETRNHPTHNTNRRDYNAKPTNRNDLRQDEIQHTDNNTRWSRTFTRKNRSHQHQNESRDSSLNTDNRFAPLSWNTEVTPAKRDTIPGKTKARSPLEDSVSFKKQRDETINIDTNSDPTVILNEPDMTHTHSDNRQTRTTVSGDERSYEPQIIDIDNSQ